MHSNHRLFEELARHSGVDLDTRAENAFNVAVRFMSLLEEMAPNEKAYDLMMKAWMRAVKDGDFSKFRRTYRKYINEPDSSKPT